MGRVFEDVRAVAFGDVDWAKILYYPRFFHYCHMSFEAFMGEALGMPYVDFLEKKGLGFPTVHLEADYRRPLPYGVDLHVAITLVELNTRSMVLRYRGRTGPDEEPRVEARVTNVLVGMDGFTSCPIPDWVRTALEPWLEDG